MRARVVRVRSWMWRGDVRSLFGWRVFVMMEDREEKRAGRRRGKEKKAMKGQR